jgi:hypothetical protein
MLDFSLMSALVLWWREKDFGSEMRSRKSGLEGG